MVIDSAWLDEKGISAEPENSLRLDRGNDQRRYSCVRVADERPFDRGPFHLMRQKFYRDAFRLRAKPIATLWGGLAIR